ncbi:MAG: hypothetical protein DDT31_00420 [Syntrophomonadaceae bacterium]|nr:hypothetical protein [Bacillota bacterium]
MARKLMKFMNMSLLVLFVLTATFYDNVNAEGKNDNKQRINLIKNGGFENEKDGMLLNWGVRVPFTHRQSAENKSGGEYSLEMFSDKKEVQLLVSQDILEFELNQNYRLEYNVMSSKFGTDYRVYIGVWKGPKWLAGVDTEWRQANVTWQKVTHDFKLDKQADRLMIVIEAKAPAKIWFDNLSLKIREESEKNHESAKLPPPLPQFIGSPKFVQITPDRQFTLAGKPFFSLGVWGWHPTTEEAMAKAYDFGFNTIRTYHAEALGKDILKSYLEMCRKYNMKLIVTTRFEFPDGDADSYELFKSKSAKLTSIIPAIREHPSLFGYDVADEPALAGFNIDLFAKGTKLMRRLDPYHPLLTSHAPRNTIAELAKYNRYVDVGGTCIYPVWDGPDRHSDLENETISVVGDETIKNLKAVDYKKPVIMTLQGNSWSDMTERKGEPVPTGKQLRFMGYDAIVSGATGIHYYVEGAWLRDVLKPVVREFSALQDVLAAGKTIKAKLTSTPQLRLLIKKYKGYYVIIAVNRKNQSVKATFNLAGLNEGIIKRLYPLFGNQKIVLDNNKFSEDFGPFDVRVYTNCPNPEDILREHIPLKMSF